jgi:microcystin-dependent protein
MTWPAAPQVDSPTAEAVSPGPRWAPVGGGETETLTLAQLPTGIYLGDPCAGDQRERSVRAERTGYQLDASPRRAGCPRRGNCRHSYSGNNSISVTSNNTGCAAHPNVQPTIVCNYIMRIV